MPLHYGSITTEHTAVRENAGLFDVSHMGRIELEGPDVEERFGALVTRRIHGREPGRVIYTLVTTETGGVMDDILVYVRGGNRLSLVVNASNRRKLLTWFRERLPGTITITDRTLDTAMVALQGPGAIAIAAGILGEAVNALRFYRFDPEAQSALFAGRTGYTGEDGVEVWGAPEAVLAFCRDAVAEGAVPAGLGARDILRLEMGYPLYGHEMDETVSPLKAGLGWAVELDKHEFTGASVLRAEVTGGIARSGRGLVLRERGIPRQDCRVFRVGEQVGAVTSGGFSPSLEKGIALVRLERVVPDDTNPSIVIRGRSLEAEWKPLPLVPDRTARASSRSTSEG